MFRIENGDMIVRQEVIGNSQKLKRNKNQKSFPSIHVIIKVIHQYNVKLDLKYNLFGISYRHLSLLNRGG